MRLRSYVPSLVFLPLAFLLFAFPSLAQDAEQALIKGKVVDVSTGDPLEFANVSVLDPETKSMASGGVTDFDGNFEIPVAPGTYVVRVDFLSYQPVTIDDVVVSEAEPTAVLNTVEMSQGAQLMDEVEVVTSRSQVEIGLDKKVYNVAQGMARTGGSAADILENIPSVTVDMEGNVALRGSGNVRILIDGKPSGLVGIGDASGLDLLQGNLIESIEIVTNPSAKYQAEGTAGIINIVMKKERREGVNGSFDLNAGYPYNFGAAANVNVRKSFVNLFGNFGVSYRERLGKGTSEQRFFREDTTYYTLMDRDFNRIGRNANFQVGADFYLNPKNTLTTSFLYRKGLDGSNNTTTYRDFDEFYDPSGINTRTDDETEDEYTLEYKLNYRKSFDRDGQLFTVDVQYQDNSETEQSDIEELIFDANMDPSGEAPLLQRTLNDEMERSLLVQADYTHPLGEEGQFEAGLMSTLRQIDNLYSVEEFDDGGDWGLLPGLSNHFLYDEYIHAAYGTIGNKSGRWSYQAGLRAEYSDIRTRLVETSEENDRNYLNLFPTLHLGYQLAGDNTIQVSYSRRIRRPRFWDLNPFFSFSDARNIRSGNPNLDPELTDSYELSHIKYWNAVSLSSAVYYRHTTDVMERITEVINDTTYHRPTNLSTENSFGAEFVISADIGKWWRLNASANLFKSMTDGGDLGEEFQVDAFGWNARMNSTMTVWKKLDLQTQFNYRAPQDRAQGRRLGYAHVDMGFRLDVFKGNGTLNLNVQDVFNTRKYRFITDIEGYYSTGSFQRGTTTVVLGLTYRINQQKKRGGDRGERGEGGPDGDFDGGEF